MVHRYYSIALAFASIFASSNIVDGTEVHIPSNLRVSKDAATTVETDGDDNHGRWMKFEKTEERGVQCKAMASKSKMKAGRECQGGVKQSTHAGIGSLELAEGVSVGIQDMYSNMVPEQTSILIPEETMTELMSWDDAESSGLDVFGEEDCSEEGKPCKKKLEFGGYFKLFWGCNVTVSRKGMKMSKDVVCGGKSYEGMGKKDDMGYFGTDEYDDQGDWVQASMTLGKGAKCKTGRKGKMCEGGIKKGMTARLGAEDLAMDVSDEIRDMHSNYVVPDQNSLLVTEESIQELMIWDDAGLAYFEGLDRGKKVEFGGHANLFWGCNITFSKKGKKIEQGSWLWFQGFPKDGKVRL